MRDNEKLSRWQGWERSQYKEDYWLNPENNHQYWKYPDYLNDDAANSSLLDTLVEKGYEYTVCGSIRKVDCRIHKNDIGMSIGIKPTRREAVVAAVLELIEKEASHDV